MRKIIVPESKYCLLAGLYLVASGSSIRVDALSLAVLALAILVPGLWAAHVGSPRKRVVLCAALALVAMLSWDLFSHLVIMKVEPLQVLFGRPWAYVFGMVALSGVSLLSAYLGAPPRYS
jgi:Kef-type K+ transport system membrane component KefB